MTTVVPYLDGPFHLIGLVDRVDRFGDIPETNRIVSISALGGGVSTQYLLVQRHIVSNTSEFALNANPAGVIRARWGGIEWRAALRTGIVVIVLAGLVFGLARRKPTYTEIPCAMVVPARCGIH